MKRRALKRRYGHALTGGGTYTGRYVHKISKGRFVSYVGRSGKMVPIGYPR